MAGRILTCFGYVFSIIESVHEPVLGVQSKDYLARLCQADQEIARTYELIESFTTMLREQQGDQLDSWLKVVKEQGVVELQSFAQGLERDYDAVKAGLTLKWSQGPVEGAPFRRV